MLIFGKYTEEQWDRILGYTPNAKELAERARRAEREKCAKIKEEKAKAFRQGKRLVFGKYTEEEMDTFTGHTPSLKELAWRAEQDKRFLAQRAQMAQRPRAIHKASLSENISV